MTNLQIIANEAIANNLYTEQEVEKIFAAGYRLPIHTFAEWKRMGYIVRKGEHATITTRLWKFTNKKAGRGRRRRRESGTGSLLSGKSVSFH